MIDIGTFMVQAFVRILPFILISIPFSVFINLSGKSVHVGDWFRKKPMLAIVAAVLFGSLSPLCSCTVIPVIYSLLLSGVPLGPVMAFWLSSPSMDPEIFFLSLVTIGAPLSIARLVVTFLLSLGGGYITHFLDQKGFFGTQYLRDKPTYSSFSIGKFLRKIGSGLHRKQASAVGTTSATGCCAGAQGTSGEPASAGTAGCCSSPAPKAELPLSRRILEESTKMTIFIVKFILLALFLEALITLYLPEEFIPAMLSGRGWLGVPLAALFGVPFYTSGLAALGIVSGLLAKGLTGSAALAFLVAGPTTTLPAMTAVFGITKRRVFLVYLSLVLCGALVFGWLYGAIETLFAW